MHPGLTRDNLLPHGPLKRIGRQFLAFRQIDSTNAFLLARAAELSDGTIACTEFQTSGRGRLGRRWESPRGSSILLSVLLHEPVDSPLVTRATWLAALAACDAVDAATSCRPGVRWPNDLMLSGRKFGGVLVESTSHATPEPRRAVVIGLGLNCLQQPGHFQGELAHTATSLEIESTEPVDRAAVARGLLVHLDDRLAAVAGRPDAWAAAFTAWKSRCEDIGAGVTLWHDRHTYAGTVLDIGDDGDLLVQLHQGGRRYFAAATTTRLA